MKKYTIYANGQTTPFCFNGKHRKDFETDDWRFYELENGTIWQFRKENIVAIHGDTVTSIIQSK